MGACLHYKVLKLILFKENQSGMYGGVSLRSTQAIWRHLAGRKEGSTKKGSNHIGMGSLIEKLSVHWLSAELPSEALSFFAIHQLLQIASSNLSVRNQGSGLR